MRSVILFIITFISPFLHGVPSDNDRQQMAELIYEVHNLKAICKLTEARQILELRIPSLDKPENKRMIYPAFYFLGEVQMDLGNFGDAVIPLQRVYQTIDELLPDNQKFSTWIYPVTLKILIAMSKIPDSLCYQIQFEDYLVRLKKIIDLAPIKEELIFKIKNELRHYKAEYLIQELGI